jgi:hypothetical protein
MQAKSIQDQSSSSDDISSDAKASSTKQRWYNWRAAQWAAYVNLPDLPTAFKTSDGKRKAARKENRQDERTVLHIIARATLLGRTDIHISIERISVEGEMSQRAVNYAVASLIARGLLTRIAGGWRGHAAEYRLMMADNATMMEPHYAPRVRAIAPKAAGVIPPTHAGGACIRSESTPLVRASIDKLLDKEVKKETSGISSRNAPNAGVEDSSEGENAGSNDSHQEHLQEGRKEVAVGGRGAHSPESMQQAIRAVPTPAEKPALLPEDWQPDWAHVNYATKLGFINADVDRMGERFRDHWLADYGPGAFKTEPELYRSWQRWVDKELQKLPENQLNHAAKVKLGIIPAPVVDEVDEPEEAEDEFEFTLARYIKVDAKLEAQGTDLSHWHRNWLRQRGAALAAKLGLAWTLMPRATDTTNDAAPPA